MADDDSLIERLIGELQTNPAAADRLAEAVNQSRRQGIRRDALPRSVDLPRVLNDDVDVKTLSDGTQVWDGPSRFNILNFTGTPAVAASDIVGVTEGFMDGFSDTTTTTPPYTLRNTASAWTPAAWDTCVVFVSTGQTGGLSTDTRATGVTVDGVAATRIGYVFEQSGNYQLWLEAWVYQPAAQAAGGVYVPVIATFPSSVRNSALTEVSISFHKNPTTATPVAHVISCRYPQTSDAITIGDLGGSGRPCTASAVLSNATGGGCTATTSDAGAFSAADGAATLFPASATFDSLMGGLGPHGSQTLTATATYGGGATQGVHSFIVVSLISAATAAMGSIADVSINDDYYNQADIVIGTDLAGASFITVNAESGLGAERQLFVGNNMLEVDNGANSSVDLSSWLRGPDQGSNGAMLFPLGYDYFHVTGTTTISTFTSNDLYTSGYRLLLEFDSALTLTHSASLILPGAANITTQAGDVFEFVADNTSGSIWRLINMSRPTSVSGEHHTAVGVVDTTVVSTTVPYVVVGPFAYAATITGVEAVAGSNVTAGATSGIYDVHKILAANANTDGQGTTIFTTQANRPTISNGNKKSTTTAPDVTAIAAGDYLAFYVDQQGTNLLDVAIGVRMTMP